MIEKLTSAKYQLEAISYQKSTRFVYIGALLVEILYTDDVKKNLVLIMIKPINISIKI